MLLGELSRNADFSLAASNVAPSIWKVSLKKYTLASWWTDTFGAPDEFSDVLTPFTGVTQNYLNKYTETISYDDCLAQIGSFYFDTNNQVVYIHCVRGFNPIVDFYDYQYFIGFSKGEIVYVNDFEYLPLIKSVPDINQEADDSSSGAISLVSGTVVLGNYNGILDFLKDEPIYGNYFKLFSYDKSTGIKTAVACFYVENHSFSSKQISIDLQDLRKGEDIKVPVDTFTRSTYPYIEDTYLGSCIPFLIGRVAAIELVPVNGNYDSDNCNIPAVYRLPDGISDIGNALVCIDDAWTAVEPYDVDYTNRLLTITNGRDSNGSTLTVKLLEPTGVLINGHSYPADVIVYLNALFLGINFINSNYNISEWNTEAASSLICGDIGLFLDSQVELYELIFEITNKGLGQFRYEFTPEARRTIRVKNFGRDVSRAINSVDIKNVDELAVESKSDDVYSSIVLKYFHNYVEDSDLDVEDTTYYNAVISKYRTQAELELETFLNTAANASARAAAEAALYGSIPLITSLDLWGNLDIGIFETIQVNIQPDDSDSASRQYFGLKKCLVLSRNPDIENGISSITAQIQPDEDEVSLVQGSKNTSYEPITKTSVAETAVVAASATKTWRQDTEPTIGARPYAIAGDSWITGDGDVYLCDGNEWAFKNGMSLSDPVEGLNVLETGIGYFDGEEWGVLIGADGKAYFNGPEGALVWNGEALVIGEGGYGEAHFYAGSGGLLSVGSGFKYDGDELTVGGFEIGEETIEAENLVLTAGVVGVANITVGIGAHAAGLASISSADDVAVWAGSAFASRASAKFRVTGAGALYASEATISGAITATSGHFTGTVSIDSGGSLVAGDATLSTSGISGSGYSLTASGLAITKGSISIGGLFSVTSTGVMTAPSGTVGPLTIAATKMYFGGGTWSSADTPIYFDNQSRVSFGTKFSWDNTTLYIDGSGYFTGTVRSGNLGSFLTITDTSMYSGAGHYANADTPFWADSIYRFALGDKLYFDGTNLSVAGNVDSISGSIGSWYIYSGVLKSRQSGAFVGLDSSNMRFSVYDSAGAIKVALGFLGGISTYTTSNYGLYVAPGDRLIIDGPTGYKNGDMIGYNSSFFVYNASDQPALQLGAYSGNFGMHFYYAGVYDNSLYFSSGFANFTSAVAIAGNLAVNGTSISSTNSSMSLFPSNVSTIAIGTSSSVTQIQSTTASTSYSTGAFVVSGGVGVAGAIYSGGFITSSGEIIGTLQSGYGQFRAVYGNYGAFVRNDGIATYLLLTASGDPYGAYNNLRPLIIDNATGTLGTGGINTSYQFSVYGRTYHEYGAGSLDPILHLYSTSSTVNQWGISISAPNLSSGSDHWLMVAGANDSLNNKISFGYYYAGSGSTANRLGFGFFNNNYLLNVFASGNVSIGSTIDTGKKLYVDGNIYSTGAIYLESDGGGIDWGSGASRIYDNGHLHIYTDDNMYLDAPVCYLTGTLVVSTSNATGGGIVLGDAGDIVDNNDEYCSMRFTSGVRIYSGNRSGSVVATITNGGAAVFSDSLQVGTGHSYYAQIGYPAFAWNGNTYSPTLYTSNFDGNIFLLNPHVGYTSNGINGFTGSMTGATIRFASDTSASNYWDIGIGVCSVGPDMFAIGRNGSALLRLLNTGSLGLGTAPSSACILKTSGDAYLGGALEVTGVTSITSTATSTSYSTGALVVSGGAGIAGNLYVNAHGYFNHGLTITESPDYALICNGISHFNGEVAFSSSVYFNSVGVYINSYLICDMGGNAYGTYIKFYSGAMVQWGIVTSVASGSWTAVTLPASFVNSSYSISLTLDTTGSAGQVITNRDGSPSFTSSQFNVYQNCGSSQNVRWIAMGQWR